jgi:septal ring factor EnvC (AmiA/AmiB activator)
MKADHYARPNKLIGLDPEVRASDTPRMKAAQMAALEHMTGDVWRVGCDLERELAAANERIKQLEEQIFRAQKQKEITHKAIEQIAREGATSKTIEALLNAHFWELV